MTISSTCSITFLLLLSILIPSTTSSNPVELARARVLKARNWVRAVTQKRLNHGSNDHVNVALSDCAKLYDGIESLLNQVTSGDKYTGHGADERAWLSGALANYRTCLDGLEEKGFVEMRDGLVEQNLSMLFSEALGLYGNDHAVEEKEEEKWSEIMGILASWDTANSTADIVVSKDGYGTHRTIKEAVSAVARMGRTRKSRVVIYVKAGVYNENVEIEMTIKNVMFIGDGIDKTIVAGNWNVPDGTTTYGSATFGVSGDGFWARDMTFENTAGPHKHQAVALRVNSDLSVFYRCSIKGYQDTLFVHSLRQFYRDCHIYGTVDFIFGDASVVFQNCDIFVRKPMELQANMITAQGRDNPGENTAISIQNCRVMPAPEFSMIKSQFRTYLGRPWKKYSRTVFMKSYLDGMVDPKGWEKWDGSFALSTLYYGEYMNNGDGASIGNRVKWPGFHVLRSVNEVRPYTVSSLIQGHSWIPVTGVPFSLEV